MATEEQASDGREAIEILEGLGIPTNREELFKADAKNTETRKIQQESKGSNSLRVNLTEHAVKDFQLEKGDEVKIHILYHGIFISPPTAPWDPFETGDVDIESTVSDGPDRTEATTGVEYHDR